MANNKAAFIELQDVIKGILRDTWESNTALYQRYMSWAQDCVNNELNLDAFKNITGRFLSVDSATKTALLPDDFVKQVKVGLRTANEEFVPLVPNSSLIIDPIIETCDEVNEHCDCGCNDEVCYAFGESNVTTTFSNVVVNGTTYQNSVTVCAQESGDVIKRTCNWAVSNPQPLCQYDVTFTLATAALINAPFTNFYFTKNGVSSLVGDIPDVAALQSVMVADGFGLVSSGATSISFRLEDSPNVYTNITYTDVNGDVQHVLIAQTLCISPGVQYQSCNYTSDLGDLTNGPYLNVVFVVNGISIVIGDVASNTALNTILHSYGWSGNVGGIISMDTTDEWTLMTLSDDGTDKEKEIFQNECTPVTIVAPEVVQTCYEEKVCDVEIKPCGCIVVADTDIEVICACCNFSCAVTARQRKNKDFGQTFAQPKGYFGEYKIDVYKGVIKLNTDYQYDTVYVEYYSSNVVDSKSYLVPVQAKEPIIAWIYWKSLQRKRGITRWEKQDAKDDYFNEKRKMKQRLNPLNLDDFMSVVRVFQRP